MFMFLIGVARGAGGPSTGARHRGSQSRTFQENTAKVGKGIGGCSAIIGNKKCQQSGLAVWAKRPGVRKGYVSANEIHHGQFIPQVRSLEMALYGLISPLDSSARWVACLQGQVRFKTPSPAEECQASQALDVAGENAMMLGMTVTAARHVPRPHSPSPRSIQQS